MHDSDNNSPWVDDEIAAAPGPDESVFDAVPPPPVIPAPISSPIGRSSAPARPPLPVIPPPGSGSPTTSAGAGAGTSTVLAPPMLTSVPSTTVGEPLLSGHYGDTAPPIPDAPASGGGRLLWIGAVVGALVLLVGGGYLALTALQASGGAATPEEAVDRLIEAVNDEDVLTLGELLEPGERRTIVDPTIEEILPELVRLGVLSDDFDAGGIDGIDLELTDVTYRIDAVAGHDDLVHVVFTGGSASSEAVAADFEFGDEIRRRFGDSMEDQPRTTEPIDESDTPLVLVRRNDRWYVSMWYSLAEAIRLDLGSELPPVSQQPLARGSESPEGAVEQWALALADFDLEGAVGGLDPDEANALYRYSPLFLDTAHEAAQSLRTDLRADGVDWELRDLEFDVDRDGDDAIVELTAFTFELTTPDLEVLLEYGTDRVFGRLDGTVDGERVRGSVELTSERWALEGIAGGESIDAELLIDADAGSVTLSGQVSGEPFSGSLTVDETGACSDYTFLGLDQSEVGCLEELVDDAGAAELARSQILDWFTFSQRGYPSPDIAVHRTGGQWFVSPTLTTMHSVVTALQGVEQSEFDDFLDRIEDANAGEPIVVDDLLEAPFEAADGLSALGGGLFDLPLADGDLPVLDDGGTFDLPGFDPPADVEFTVTPGTEPISTRDDLTEPFERHVYLVGMVEGQELGATLSGESVVGDGGIYDPVLTVETPDGAFWLDNDDADGLDSALRFTAPTAGVWRVVVRDFGGRSGTYELTLQLPELGVAPDIGEGNDNAIDPGFGGVAEDFEEIALAPGGRQTFVGSLGSGGYDTFLFNHADLFNHAENLDVTVSLEAAEGSFLDPKLVVRRDGEVVAENDDAPVEAGLIGTLDSQLSFNVDRDAVYSIEVRSFADVGEGGYVLTIDGG